MSTSTTTAVVVTPKNSTTTHTTESSPMDTINYSYCDASLDDNGILTVSEEVCSRSLLAFVPKSQHSEAKLSKNKDDEDVAHISFSWLVERLPRYANFVINDASFSDDHDVMGFLRSLVPYVDMSFFDEKKNITRGDYYVYIVNVMKSENPYVSDLDGNVSKVVGCYVQQSLFGSVLAIQQQKSFAIDNDIRVVRSRTGIMANKIDADELPLRKATSDVVKRKANEVKKRFETYSPTQYREYNGVCYTSGFMGSTVEHFLSEDRVIVDSYALKKVNMSQLQNLIELFHDGGMDENRSSTVDAILRSGDHNIATMVDEVVFFDIHNKRWFIGHYDKLSPVHYSEDAFDKLILDNSKKEKLKAIATSKNVADTDIIRGKGSNAIFLLHGAPGTGKTLTAEALADYMNRPLYKVSLGELGTAVDELEKSLERILQLCERWNAITLIDEADVFLEERNSDNLERNAMVAVFLRMLEYYSGILFLTTNRASKFDMAFISRITLAIHYKRPDMVELWKMLLENSHIDFDQDSVDKLVDHNINGRQVKSVINTSKAIAKYRNTDVSMDIVLDSLKEAVEFSEFIENSK